MKIALYSRVSTKKQDTENQMFKLREYAKLREWDVVGEYIDPAVSGRKASRPQLDKMKQDIKDGLISGVLAWKLDRLARSVRDAIDLSEYLRRHHCELIIFGSNIDTSTAEGRFFFNVTAAFAELEAGFISERTQLAYERKKTHAESLGQRVRWGRQGKQLATDEAAHVIELRDGGMSWREIAEVINKKRLEYAKDPILISYSTLRRLFQNRGVENGE